MAKKTKKTKAQPTDKPHDVASGKGERAAMGGYLSQYDAFARFAYTELVNNKLEWIKVADSNSGQLDDIQYATLTEIHAYQVKWTTGSDPISFTDFKNLLPLIATSWSTIKALPHANNKKVVPHLLTNKRLSTDDVIEIEGVKGKIGTFSDFYNSVWIKLKSKQAIRLNERKFT